MPNSSRAKLRNLPMDRFPPSPKLWRDERINTIFFVPPQEAKLSTTTKQTISCKRADECQIADKQRVSAKNDAGEQK
jgi:hypothetical protein